MIKILEYGETLQEGDEFYNPKTCQYYPIPEKYYGLRYEPSDFVFLIVERGYPNDTKDNFKGCIRRIIK